MRMRLVCLLLALAMLSGCRSVSEFLFPPDAPDLGPEHYKACEWEQRLSRRLEKADAGVSNE